MQIANAMMNATIWFFVRDDANTPIAEYAAARKSAPR